MSVPSQPDRLPVAAIVADEATLAHAYPPAGVVAAGVPGTVVPVVRAAAAAAGGFLAGAAVVGLAHRRRRRAAALTKPRRARRGMGRAGRGSRPAAKAGESVQIVGTRSLLVDVHLLGER